MVGGAKQSGTGSAGVVEVFGGNVMSPPIVCTSDASKIVIRDSSGAAAAFLHRLADDTWIYCTRLDDDWVPACERFDVV